MGTEKYIQRLVSEWLAHGKIILGIDYDSTLSYWPSIENQDDIKRCIDLLQIAHQTGAYIVIFTACNTDRHESIQRHCEELKIPISGINAAPIPLPYGNANKIYANHFLDDRAGFIQAMDILERAMYIVRGEKATGLTAGERA